MRWASMNFEMRAIAPAQPDWGWTQRAGSIRGKFLRVRRLAPEAFELERRVRLRAGSTQRSFHPSFAEREQPRAIAPAQPDGGWTQRAGSIRGKFLRVRASPL